MTAWTRDIALASPGALAPLISDFQTLATTAGATLDAAGTSLDAAKVFLLGTISPQAAAATTLLATAQGILDDTFGAGIYRLTVHPWIPRVGHGSGLGISLSFPNAVNTILSEFDDMGDDGRPTFSSGASVSMIVLIAGAPSPAIFKQVVSGVRALIDLPALRLVERRIDQAIRHDRQRFTLPAGSRLPDWEHRNVIDVFPALFPLYSALNGALATLKGYSRGGTKAVDMAISLIDAKRAQLTALKHRLDSAAALFSGGLSNAGLYALKIEGTGGNAFLKEQLRAATGAPGHELSLCVGVALIASPAELAPIAGILGL